MSATSDTSPRLVGLFYMVLASLGFSVMGAFVYKLRLTEPEASVWVASFFRIAVNLVFVVLVAAWKGELGGILGDGRSALWLRGLFGSLSLMGAFYSVHAIGPGESQFLHASNTIWVAILSPFLLRQENSKWVWLAILMGMAGIYLLYEPRLDDHLPWGRLAALGSGFCGALAYTMVARAGRSNSPYAVIFYFCIVATALHIAGFSLVGFTWPEKPMSYVYMILAGLSASMAQIWMTMSYQMAPAALASAVSQLTPVFSLFISFLAFSLWPDPKALLGATIVFLSATLLPFLIAVQKKDSHGH